MNPLIELNGGSDLGPNVWDRVLDPNTEHLWAHSPLPSPDPAEFRHTPGRLLEELKGYLRHPRRNWLFSWVYRTQVGPATTERDLLVREAKERLAAVTEHRAVRLTEVEAEIERLSGRRTAVDDQFSAELDSFAETAALVGFSGEPDPQVLLAALKAGAPNFMEVAGAEGVAPVAVTATEPARRQLLEVLAPIVSGLMLALCLGTLVGLIRLSDLSRSDHLVSLVIAAVLGGVIVGLLGEVVETAVGALSRCLAPQHRLAPLLCRDTAITTALIAVALLLAGAEIAVEAFGLHDLHLQRLAEMQRLNTTSQPLPELSIWIYVLFGSIITGPYLAFKAARAWTGGAEELHRSWLTWRQRERQEEHCASPENQKALAHARRIERLRRTLAGTDAKLEQFTRERVELLGPATLDEATRARLRQADMTALAATERLHALVEREALAECEVGQ